MEHYARQSTGQTSSLSVGKEALRGILLEQGWSNENIIVIDDANVIGQQSCNERVDMYRLYELMKQRRFAAKARYN